MKFIFLMIIGMAVSTSVPANLSLKAVDTRPSKTSTIIPSYTPAAPTFYKNEAVSIMFN